MPASPPVADDLAVSNRIGTGLARLIRLIGRASLLAITDAGAALLDRARQRRDERIANIIEPWQHAERVQFADLIDRFTAGYEENWGGGRPEPVRGQDRAPAHR